MSYPLANAAGHPYIERLRGTLVDYGAMDHAGVAAAFNRLSQACSAPNPMYELLQEVQTEGLTKTQMQLVMLYVIFRTKPTRGEIAHFLSLIAQSSWQAPARAVLDNLNDEIKGDHDKLLHSGFDQFSNQFGIQSPTRSQYLLIKLFLKARREHDVGFGNNRKEIKTFYAQFKVLYPDEQALALGVIYLSRGRDYNFWQFLRLFDDQNRSILPLLPKNSDSYGNEITRLISSANQDPNRLFTLTPPAIRLAIRETSSAASDGISDIVGFFFRLYGGYFDHKNFRELMVWSNVHTGAEDGVEDKHAKDAIDLAQMYLLPFAQDPNLRHLLPIIFDQETEVVRIRTKLGADFAQAIRDVPGERPNEVPIAPKYRTPKDDYTRTEWILKKLKKWNELKFG